MDHESIFIFISFIGSNQLRSQVEIVERLVCGVLNAISDQVSFWKNSIFMHYKIGSESSFSHHMFHSVSIFPYAAAYSTDVPSIPPLLSMITLGTISFDSP